LTVPVLYTFRRCPYAIRARLALASAAIRYEHREVELKAKPAAMLALSPKGTVPVLQLADGTVIDESLDLMLWALHQHDPERWLDTDLDASFALIRQNDNGFKRWLDRYKYQVRYPEHSSVYYREQAEQYLRVLEQLLQCQGGAGLLDRRWTLADAAIFPFVRQFASVDRAWFATAGYVNLLGWLTQWEQSGLFQSVMHKHPLWHAA